MEMDLAMLDTASVSNDSISESREMIVKSDCLEIDPITLSNDILSVSEKKMSTLGKNSVPVDYNVVVKDTDTEWKTKKHVCDTCGKMFTAPRLWYHIRTVHKGVYCAYCEMCGKGFISGALLRRHMTVHTREKLYKCDLCDKSLSQSSALHRHKKNVHKVDSPVCQICNRCFQTEESLLSHVSVVHTKKAPEKKPPTNFSCPVCGRTYLRRRGLRTHIKSAHTERPLKFECDECGKKFAERNKLKQHFRVHNKSKENQRSFTCPVCEMVFISYEKFYKHRKVCCQAHPCSMCKEEFVSNLALSRHITNHHLNVSKGSNTTCETCGKKFRDAYHLQRHVNVHSSPVSCDKCGRKFKRMHNLLTHRKRTSCKKTKKKKKQKTVEEPKRDIGDDLSSFDDIKEEVVDSFGSDVGEQLSQKDIKVEIDNDVESFIHNKNDRLSFRGDVAVSFDNCDLDLECEDGDMMCLIPEKDIKVEVQNGVY